MSKEIKPIDDLKASLVKLSDQFKMALPSHIAPDKFIRVAQTAIAMNPNILRADRSSLFAACMTLAQAGLLPDNKESSLVCFGDKVTAMPMIGGILKKLRNSGELSTIVAEQIFENDVFKYYIDSDGQHLEHRPLLFGDRGKQLGVYALAKTKDGSVYIEVMSMADIESVKKSSRSANNGPWVTFSGEMQKKTVIRRLSKRLPMSTDIDAMMKADDDLYDFKESTLVEKEVANESVKQIEQPKAKRKSKLESIVESQDVSEPIEVKDEIPL